MYLQIEFNSIQFNIQSIQGLELDANINNNVLVQGYYVTMNELQVRVQNVGREEAFALR